MAQKSIHDERYQAVIAKLVKARNDAGMTQQQVADKLEKPQSYVAKYENCERRLDIVELEDLANTLKIKLSNLL